jgi:hypothetical protein
MRAVSESSSIPAYTDSFINDLIRSREVDVAYDPNPNGYFSHSSMFAPISEWINKTPDGSVMKAAPEAFYSDAGTEQLCVVLISRKQEEIDASYTRSFGALPSNGLTSAWSQAEQTLTTAPNVTLTKLDFADLISDPTGSFTALAAAGWPIDVTAAANLIDPSLYRNQ